MDDSGVAWAVAAFDANERVWGVALASTEPAATVHRVFVVGGVGACVAVGAPPVDWQGRWVLGLVAQGVPPRAVLEDLGRVHPDAGMAWACVGPTGQSSAVAWSAAYTALAEPGLAIALDDDGKAAGSMEAVQDVWRRAQDLPLADRLQAMLQAATRPRGGTRHVRSAALVTASGPDASGQGTHGLDLRVDDHTDPLAEMERLCDVVAVRRDASRGPKRTWTADLREAVDAALRQLGAARTGDAAEDVPHRLRAWLLARRMADEREAAGWVTADAVEERVYRAVQRAAARHCVGSGER